MTIVIAGGTGFLGQKLAKRLANAGHRVLILTRRPSTSTSNVKRDDDRGDDRDRTSTSTPDVNRDASTSTPDVKRDDDRGDDRDRTSTSAPDVNRDASTSTPDVDRDASTSTPDVDRDASTSTPDVEREIQWRPDGTAGHLARQLEGVDAVVNLAGEGIADKRWNADRKEALRQSRLLSTRTLARAIKECARPPRVFVSGSGVGYYGAHGDDRVTETTPPGTDFLARLCVEWEQEARAAESRATRVVIIRTGLALDGHGGALAKMLLPFKLGLGATIGSGDQFMPWIHVDDWTALVACVIDRDRASGPFNATAPEPVTNREFTRTLGRVLRRPAFFVAPAFVLQMALGELASALLTGQRALPAGAEQLGFRFTHRTLEPALRSLNL